MKKIALVVFALTAFAPLRARAELRELKQTIYGMD
jgi:hypothetical protein